MGITEFVFSLPNYRGHKPFNSRKQTDRELTSYLWNQGYVLSLLLRDVSLLSKALLSASVLSKVWE